VSINEYQL